MRVVSIGILARQLAGFGVVLLLLLAVGYVGWRNTAVLSSAFEDLVRHKLKAATHLAQAERALWELRFGLPNYISGDGAAREKIRAASDKWIKQVEDNLKAYAALPLTEAERELFKPAQKGTPGSPGLAGLGFG